MKFTVLKPFLFGFTCGIGITLLSLYARKPGCFVTSIERLAEVGRTRRAKEEEKKLALSYQRATKVTNTIKEDLEGYFMDRGRESQALLFFKIRLFAPEMFDPNYKKRKTTLSLINTMLQIYLF